MSSMMPKIGPIFQYGFLATSASRIIALYQNKPSYKLSENNKAILKKAEKYIDDILTSQDYISGQRDAGVPSGYGLKAFKNAVNTIPKFHTEAVNSSEKRKELFERVKNVLNDMVDKPKASVEPNDLKIANEFFGNVADLYLNEAEHEFNLESSKRPL